MPLDRYARQAGFAESCIDFAIDWLERGRPEQALQSLRMAKRRFMEINAAHDKLDRALSHCWEYPAIPKNYFADDGGGVSQRCCDRLREELATRVWFELRRGGCMPWYIVALMSADAETLSAKAERVPELLDE